MTETLSKVRFPKWPVISALAIVVAYLASERFEPLKEVFPFSIPSPSWLVLAFALLLLLFTGIAGLISRDITVLLGFLIGAALLYPFGCLDPAFEPPVCRTISLLDASAGPGFLRPLLSGAIGATIAFALCILAAWKRRRSSVSEDRSTMDTARASG